MSEHDIAGHLGIREKLLALAPWERVELAVEALETIELPIGGDTRRWLLQAHDALVDLSALYYGRRKAPVGEVPRG